MYAKADLDIIATLPTLYAGLLHNTEQGAIVRALDAVRMRRAAPVVVRALVALAKMHLHAGNRRHPELALAAAESIPAAEEFVALAWRESHHQ